MFFLFLILARTAIFQSKKKDLLLDEMFKELYFNTNKIGKETFSNVEEFTNLNVIVIGKTGVGKSTLINSVFRDVLADAGAGKPMTRNIQLIRKDGVPLSIYDAPGFELDPKKQKNIQNDLFKLIKTNRKTQDPKKCIHCIWYCVDYRSKRFEDYELQFIRQICLNPSLGNIPFFILATKCDNKNDNDFFIDYIKNENLGATEIIPVLAQDFVINGKVVAYSFGIDNLVSLMNKNLPDFFNATMNSIFDISLKKQRLKSRLAVIAATTTAATVSSGLIPVASLGWLLHIEWAMIESINFIYKIDPPDEFALDFILWFFSKKEIISQGSNINQSRACSVLIDENEIPIESKKTIDDYNDEMKQTFSKFTTAIDTSSALFAKYLNKLKGFPVLSIPVSAFTVLLGETYRRFVEQYCINNQKLVFNRKMKSNVEFLLKKVMDIQENQFLKKKSDRIHEL